MLRILNRWFAILFVLIFHEGERGSKPELSHRLSEVSTILGAVSPSSLSIKAGQSLELTCTSTEEIKFHYPDNVNNTFILDTSPAILNKSDINNGQRKIVLRRPNAVPGDTGWYGCSNAEVNITSGNYDDPQVSWTYVYVESKSNYFVNANTMGVVNAIQGKSFVIPCRPTSPDYNVTLKSFAFYEIIEMGDRAAFDPKTGFIVQKARRSDTGIYTCKISGDHTDGVSFFLNIIIPWKFSAPRIYTDLRHVVRGQTLHVNCTTVLDRDANYLFNWTTPRQSSKITTRTNAQNIRSGKKMVTSELIIDGITNEEEGDYTCTITTPYISKSTKTSINIYEEL